MANKQATFLNGWIRIITEDEYSDARKNITHSKPKPVKSGKEIDKAGK